MSEDPRLDVIDWVRDTAERALKTFLQTLLPLLGGVVILAPDWEYLVGAVAVAGWSAMLSTLTSVASSLRGDPASASMLKPRHRAPLAKTVIRSRTITREPGSGDDFPTARHRLYGDDI